MNHLIPRVQLMFWYPGSPFKVNEILELSNGHYVNANGAISEEDVELCPMIFLRLEWYESRSEAEMPTYIASDDGVFKVLQHFKGVSKDRAKCFNGIYDTTESYWHMRPATYEEYQQQLIRNKDERLKKLLNNERV